MTHFYTEKQDSQKTNVSFWSNIDGLLVYNETLNVTFFVREYWGKIIILR